MLYALIKGNSVANVIVADADFIGLISHDWDHIEPLDTLHEQGLGVGIGWVWDGAQFVGPAHESPAQLTERKVSNKAFLSRFTDDEAIDIDLASIGATREAAAVRRYLSKVNAAQHIDLADEETRKGVQALEAAGLLQPGRALAILDAPIQPKELP